MSSTNLRSYCLERLKNQNTNDFLCEKKLMENNYANFKEKKGLTYMRGLLSSYPVSNYHSLTSLNSFDIGMSYCYLSHKEGLN